MTMNQVRGALGLAALIACALPGAATAQVPEDIYQVLFKIGQIVDPACTAKFYRPLMPAADYNTYWAPGAAAADMSKAKLYPGVTIHRDVKFGEHAKDLLDIFVADSGGGNRPIFIWVPGGGGNKIEQVPDGDAFYDNVMLWAVKNGMVGVNVQRLGGGGRAWDDPARDIGMVISWVNANIAKYKGNPQRVFIWAHSAGTGPTSAYITQTQAHPPAIGVGLKGAILMGGNLNIAPVVVTAAGRGGAAGGRAGGGGGRGAQDPAVTLARSNLPGFKSTPVALFFGAGEIDTPGAVAFVPVARTEICRGKMNCQAVIFKDHSHMSSVFSPNTADETVTGPILKWMLSVR